MNFTGPFLRELLEIPKERFYKQESAFYELFYTYATGGEEVMRPDPCTISLILCGRRKISRGLLAAYADPENPLCPRMLFEDVRVFVNDFLKKRCEQEKLVLLLDRYIEVLPPLDKQEMVCLEEEMEQDLKERTSRILTKMLVFLIRMDLANVNLLCGDPAA